RAFARRALAGGADVTLAARSADTLDEMVSHPGPEGGRVTPLVVDASQPTALRDTVATYADACDPAIDCALFNVSAWVPGGLNSDLDAVSSGLDAGVVAALAMTQAVVPRMLTQSSPRILFTGGGTADSPMVASIGLGLQKAALRNLAIARDKDQRETPIAVRTLTIRGSIAPETAFDPDRIARALWDIADSDGVVHEFTGAGD
ncbi:MAG: SDR family oxidoreductase, partial [Actinomycetota bacterium]|nr:SDR family oxidoreductase [Actinomycetota bacterium]